MKYNLFLIAAAMAAALSMVSCKNNNKSQGPTQEDVQEMKQALADSVLAKIDECYEQFINYSNNADIFSIIKLEDEEIIVKPDYLLDPSEASNFVTREQKINALAIYDMEYYLRLLYDMPTDEVKEVVASLAVELNHPIDGDFLTSDKLVSELISEEYRVCRERGELTYFWQFENAILCETDYLLAMNPDLFLSRISEDNLIAYNEQWHSIYRAIWALAPYDYEIDQIAQSYTCKNDDDYFSGYGDFAMLDIAIKTYKSDKYHFIERRNALLR